MLKFSLLYLNFSSRGFPPALPFQVLFVSFRNRYCCRYWIYVGIAFNLFAFFVFTNLAGLCLACLKPPSRPVTIKLKAELKKSLQCAPPTTPHACC